MNDITGLLNRLGLARVAAMSVVAVLMLGFFAFLILRVSAPNMAPLYTGLSFDDSAAIVSELQSTGVTYELRGEGDSILVPRDQITSIRMTLAQDGLPSGGQVGYEIFDQQSTLGATSFVQDVNLVRALEGELARTIASLARVRTARVHLVLPRRELFQRDSQNPTASIALGVRGTLDGGEIRAIQHLVSSAVEGMSPNMVSIVDDTGRLLAAGGDDSDTAMMAQGLEERTQALETRLRTRIEDLLANVVGAGRARVQVSAELDLMRSTRTSETFDPEGQVLRSAQTLDQSSTSADQVNGGAVTAGDQLPGTTGDANVNGSSDESSTTEETLNYEISKSTETEVNEAGSIKRLSVAVVVDGTYVQDNSGAATYEPRSDAALEQINALVRSAMGFDESRGDIVEVVNMQFAERPEITGLGTEAPGLFDFTRDDLMSGAQMIVTLLIALALVLFVMRPLIKRVLEPEAPMALAPTTKIADQSVEAAEPTTEHVPAPAPPTGPPAWLDNAKNQGAEQVRTLETVGDLVGGHPKQAAVIVRDWLHEAA